MEFKIDGIPFVTNDQIQAGEYVFLPKNQIDFKKMSDGSEAASICSKVNNILQKYEQDCPVIGVDTNVQGMHKIFKALQHLDCLIEAHSKNA